MNDVEIKRLYKLAEVLHLYIETIVRDGKVMFNLVHHHISSEQVDRIDILCGVTLKDIAMYLQDLIES